MKTIRLLVCIIVAMALTGCEASTIQPATQKVEVPNLGGYVTLATMDEGQKVVTFYKDSEMVCIEHGGNGDVYNGSAATWTCWGTNEAPAPLRKLAEQYKLRFGGKPLTAPISE